MTTIEAEIQTIRQGRRDDRPSRTSPPKAKRQITQLLDTFIEREKLKQRRNAQGA